MDAGLAGAHRRCDPELLNEMFRSAHSLKGLSAMLGLTEINYAHAPDRERLRRRAKDELAIDRRRRRADVSGRGPAGEPCGRPPASPPPSRQVPIGDRRRLRHPPQAGTDAASPPRPTPIARWTSSHGLGPRAARGRPARHAPRTRLVHKGKRSNTTASRLSDPFAAIGDEQRNLPEIPGHLLSTRPTSRSTGSPRLCSHSRAAAAARRIEKLLVTAPPLKGSSTALGLNRVPSSRTSWKTCSKSSSSAAAPFRRALPTRCSARPTPCGSTSTGLRRGRPGTDRFADPATALVAAPPQVRRSPLVAAATRALRNIADNAVAIPPGLCEAVAADPRRAAGLRRCCGLPAALAVGRAQGPVALR